MLKGLMESFGVCKFTEQFLTKWINNIIKKTKIDNVLISGVAQNIKALKLGVNKN